MGIVGKGVDHSNNSSELDFLRPIQEDIQNQNHELQEQIFSL